MKLTQNKKDLILEQVLNARAQTEGEHSTILDKWNDSYLYSTSQRPERTEADKAANVTGIAATVVVPVIEIAINNAMPFLRDSFVSKGRVSFAFRDRGFRSDPQVNALIESNINKIFLRDNDGKTLLENAIKDSLSAGDPFAKVFPEIKTYTNAETLSDWEPFTGYARNLVNGWFVDVPADFATTNKGNSGGFEWKTIKQDIPDPQTGQDVQKPIRLIRGTIPLKMVDKKIKVDPVELKDLYLDTTHGNDFSKVTYICHSRTTTVGEAELLGYDPEILARAALKQDDNLLPSLFFSDKYSGKDGSSNEFESTDPKQKAIKIDEHYILSSLLHRKGETRRYQVITCGDELLEVNEILDFPFVHGQTETILGSFWGRSFYDKAKQIQDIKTQQLRLILNNAEQTIHPRYLAVKGMYNRESLLQASRPGAVIEQGTAGAIEQFPQHTLSPEFYQAWELITGIEGQLLIKGFSSQDLKDVSPLSTVTIAMGIAEDSKKNGVASSNFGRTFVKPLIDLIYKTMKALNWTLEDENGQPVENFVYPELYDIDPEINTSGDDAAKVMQMQAVAAWEAQMSQTNSPVITPQNRYEMALFMLQRADIDASKYITDPSTQVDPHAQQEAAQAAFVESEKHRGQLVSLELDNQLRGAQIAKLVVDMEESIYNGENKRAIDQQDAITRAQAEVNKAQAKVAESMTNAQRVDNENKRDNLDFVLGATKAHSEHINRVNGIMR
ncbi:hypothetical protein N2U02_004478 [Salmonella enterica]|nr:hypothetical protein [Salmonella enterica]